MFRRTPFRYKLFVIQLIAVQLFVFSSCKVGGNVYVSTSFREPANEGLRFIYSEDGLQWDSIPGTWLKPAIGTQQVLRDPSIVQSPDGVFHLVWTTSWKGDLGFGYANSKDLINWSEPRMIEVMKNEPTTINVWAPELFYDDEKQEFVIVWASCIPNRFELGEEEEDNNHRLFYATTKDFQTFSDTKLFYDPNFSCIDATIVKRAKLDYVMIFKDNTRPNRNLKVAFAISPTGPYSKPSSTFSDEFVEGPTVEKIKNEYYIYFDEYRKFSFGAVKTTDFIHFDTITDKLSMPQGHKHGTIFKAPVSIINNLKKNYELGQKQKINSSENILSGV
ncbi:glycoside hydrolase family 43 protein, partial [bacterium]|nr:glycoside hydrolase family 43 protein [bacterium]